MQIEIKLASVLACMRRAGDINASLSLSGMRTLKLLPVFHADCDARGVSGRADRDLRESGARAAGGKSIAPRRVVRRAAHFINGHVRVRAYRWLRMLQQQRRLLLPICLS